VRHSNMSAAQYIPYGVAKIHTIYVNSKEKAEKVAARNFPGYIHYNVLVCIYYSTNMSIMA
jgi:hypothetical protein